MLEAVILAGGRGERFWPLSRPQRPKQLLRLCGEETLLATTWRRLRARLEPSQIWVLAGESLAPAIAAELPELPADRLVLESVGRDTAPALAVAAALGRRAGRDPVQIVAPSDHWIGDVAAFWESAVRAAAVAEAADAPLVTFGIPISRPDTGYGYLERGHPRPEARGVWQVARFHEKPDEETARKYQASGRHFWNSGIFVWRASSLLAEVALRMPELHALVCGLSAAPGDPRALLPEIFRRAPARSIDYGVLEQCDRVAVVQADFDWSDVGTWRSWGELVAGADANAARGDVLALESEGCVLYSEGGTLAVLGVRDLVIVHTADATLVVPRSRSQEVRKILQALKSHEEGAPTPPGTPQGTPPATPPATPQGTPPATAQGTPPATPQVITQPIGRTTARPARPSTDPGPSGGEP